jgi:hypothetical protein
MSSSYIAALTAVIKAHGGTNYAVEHGGKHPRLVFWPEGQRLTYVFPATPSDHRGIHNALSNLHRLMGVRRQLHKSARPRPRRRNGGGSSGAPAAPAPLVITVRQNPFDQLGLLLQRMVLAANVASASAGRNECAGNLS